MTRSLKRAAFSYKPGKREAELALECFRRADDKRRAAIMWDCEPGEKVAFLLGLVPRAVECCAYYDDEGVCAFAWTHGNAPVGVAHFFTACPLAFATCLGALEGYLAATRKEGLWGIVPRPFRGARGLLEAAGFERICDVPGAAWLAARGRAVGAINYLWMRDRGLRARL